MRKLVGQQVRALKQFGVEKKGFRCAIVTGFVMFHPVRRYAVAKREQKIVAAVMPRSKEHSCFCDQLAEVLHFYRRCLERGGPVGDNMHSMGWLLARREVDVAQVRAGNQG